MAGLGSVSGTVYYDCLQLEEGQFCSRHNLIENNDFRDGMTGFTKSSMDMFDGVVSLNSSDTAPKTMIASGIITADVLNVRSGPGTGYSVVTSVSYGKRVNILANASDSAGTIWNYIAYSSGTAVYSGYVSSDWVNKDQPSVAIGRGMINTDILNVRSGAGTGYTALTYVTQDMAVDILENITSSAGQIWNFITYMTGGTRYSGCVLSDYIKTYADLPPAPSVPAVHEPLDANVLRITGKAGAVKKATQTLAITGNTGDVYVVNAWGASDSVALKDDRSFGTEVEFIYTDGTKDNFVSNFGAATPDWQYLSDVVIAKKAYSSINVSYIYGKNENIAYFDGLAFYKEEFGASYTYDDKGNVLNTQDAAKKNNSFEYDANNNLTKIIDAKGHNFKYTYDSRHNITAAVTAANCKFTFTYDSYGNPTEGKVVNAANENEYIRTTAAYTNTGNNIASVTDALGNTVSYAYNNKDILASATDALNRTTSYDYNALNQLTSVMQNVTIGGNPLSAYVGYGYENDRLTTISHNGFAYNLAYDGFGNRTSTMVAGQKLADYHYEPNNGVLLSLEYGNGKTLVYNYDAFDRVVGVSMSAGSEVGTMLYEYVYDNQGNVAIVKDRVNNVDYRHYYDLSDRLVMTADSLGNSFTYIYDANNNLTKLITRGSAGASVAEYTYDADNRETVTKTQSKTRTTAYDALGRMTSRTWNTGTAFATTYAYKAGVNGSQTSQLASVNNNGSIINYTYDANGNITAITDAAGTTTYTYNELNWLVRENNHTLGKTITYTYDAAGNIQHKDTYALTTAAALPGTPEQSVAYTYDDTWRDKMTGFGNSIVIYDAIGNPTRYGTWNMSWTQGRRLESIDGFGGNTILYSYNESGIRTGKTDLMEGLTYQYQLAGDKVVAERCTETMSGDEMYASRYMYDSAGSIVSMIYNGTEYYYVKNGQGDVIGLIDGAGTTVVNYTYDSWGKLQNVTGDTTLGYRNPFRYRGYFMDDETGFYYLGSRYYDQEAGRFISPDDLDTVGETPSSLCGKNLYAYCDNNPNGRIDIAGGFWLELGIMAVGGLIGAGINAISSAVTQKVTTGTVNWKSVAVAAGSGFVSGAVAASPLGQFGQMIVGGIIGGASYIADSLVNSKPIKIGETVASIIGGVISGRVGGEGANKYKAVSDAINNTKRIVAKETRRASYKYSQKAIERACNSLYSSLSWVAWSASVRFTLGIAASNFFVMGVSAVANSFRKR